MQSRLSNSRFIPQLESLENRCVPAMIYGWHNGTYAFFGDGKPAQDIMPVVVPSIVKAIAAAPVANADGTLSATITVAAIQGDSPAALGAALLVKANSPVITNASQANLVGLQTDAGSANIAYATWQPGQSFASASFTLTFSPAAEPTIAFSFLSPLWIGEVDVTALDAYFAQH